MSDTNTVESFAADQVIGSVSPDLQYVHNVGHG